MTTPFDEAWVSQVGRPPISGERERFEEAQHFYSEGAKNAASANDVLVLAIGIVIGVLLTLLVNAAFP